MGNSTNTTSRNSRNRRRYRGRRGGSSNSIDKDLGSLRSVSTQSTSDNSSSNSAVKGEFNRTRSRNRNFSKNRAPNSDRQPQGKKDSNISSRNLKKDRFSLQEQRRQFIRSEFSKYSRKSGRNNRNNRFRSRIKRDNPPYKVVDIAPEVCYLCSKPISSMSTALFDEDKEKYSHFECMFDKLKDTLTLSESERITYVGNGAFAVIEDYQDGDAMKFRIKKKYQMVTPRAIK